MAPSHSTGQSHWAHATHSHDRAVVVGVMVVVVRAWGVQGGEGLCLPPRVSGLG